MFKAVRYILFIVLLVQFLSSTSSVLSHLREMVGINYNPIPFFLAQFILYLLTGVMIGLFDRLSDHYLQPGVWSFDIVRFVTLALPCLFISSCYLLAYTPIGYLFQVSFGYLINLQPEIITLLTGYFTITCLHKKQITFEDAPA